LVYYIWSELSGSNATLSMDIGKDAGGAVSFPVVYQAEAFI
jgi:hypothetical protein